MTKFRGIFPVPLTPFNESNQAVDYERLRQHVEFILNAGAHGLVANGSTSEFALLSREESVKVSTTIIEQNRGRVPVIFGATAPSTWETIEVAKIGEDIGADGLMMLPPYYYPLSDDEILSHFDAVAQKTKLPIMLYNNPGTSKIDIKPPLVARLAEIDNIKYIKESTGLSARIHEIKALSGNKIDIFVGSDVIFFDALVSGAVGAIASSGNVIPAQMVEVYNLVSQGKFGEARARFEKIALFCSYVDGSHKFVQVLKTALEIIGKPLGPPRHPLLPVTGADREFLVTTLKIAGLC
jgi:4-hydroxy-tetrahydrodipicolinate synthase